MDEDLVRNAQLYASVQGLTLTERLGFGIHGIIFTVKGNAIAGNSAIKIHRSVEPYERELAVYRRIEEASVNDVLGFRVPRLLAHDDVLQVIQMTVVTRPFLLDFAGAYLDNRPSFPGEVWEAWENEKKDQFGAKWEKVEDVLIELRKLGIYMVDVSPSNIAF